MADKYDEDIFAFRPNKRVDKQSKLQSASGANDLTPNDLASNNNKNKCDITGDIVSYKKRATPPEGGVPPEGGAPPEGGVPPTGTSLDVIAKILEEHHKMLQQIASIEESLRDFLTGYSETGTYVEIRTATTVATLVQPTTPDTTADANAFPPIPGYDFIDINKQKQGQNARKLWVINDGPSAPGVGDNLFVITSSDGKTFSPEFIMIVGETRLINNVYEVRIRSPRAGNAVRITEREAMVPYVTTVSNTLTPVSNRSTFTARRIGVPFPGPAITLPNIVIADTFKLSVRANVDNVGNGRVYIAGPDPGGDPIVNAGNPALRNTLAPGDTELYMISNANLVAVIGNMAGLYIDISVEI